MAWIKVGDYDINIRTELGSGTFGKVYRGRHSTRKTDIAAKKILLDGSRSAKEYVLTEVNTLSRVRHHPCILHLMHHAFLDYLDEFENEVHELWLVTELCHAGNLSDYHKSKRMEFDEKVRISRQCAGAIAFLHSMDPPILHRDIKAGNVLIKLEGGVANIKMADFGLAQSSSQKTVFSTVGGSMQYMAPELFSPQPKYRKMIDTFSLGILLGHLIKAVACQDLEDENCE